ncbi:MAG: hypothetical protein RIT43_1791 [Bacteroidota bacterium]|jgi:uncharacterized protein YndB with AHSA1/START domain
MPVRTKFELEYVLKTSPKVLENMLSTPSGLSEWFADDVNVKGDVFTFIWEDSEQQARHYPDKQNRLFRFQWIEDEDEGNDCFFEIGYSIDALTKDVILKISDFAESDEIEDSKLLWEQQIVDLRRTLGC